MRVLLLKKLGKDLDGLLDLLGGATTRSQHFAALENDGGDFDTGEAFHRFGMTLTAFPEDMGDFDAGIKGWVII